MKSTAKTVDEYLKSLPEDRREAISAIRKVILDNLPKGYEECMSYGMIGYVVPHRIYPKGYQCNPKLPLPFVNLGRQKNHTALYLMCIYGTREKSRCNQLALFSAVCGVDYSLSAGILLKDHDLVGEIGGH